MKNAKKVVTFGEIMMRLNPKGNERFLQAESFEVSYAGGEANVAVSLANYGMKASFFTKVPAHEIGQCALNALRRYGVSTDDCARGGARLGLYFVEKGASQRPSKVIYPGMPFLRALTGSTGGALPPLWALICPRSVCQPVRLPRRRASQFPVT